jgi:hypothetical protein
LSKNRPDANPAKATSERPAGVDDRCLRADGQGGAPAVTQASLRFFSSSVFLDILNVVSKPITSSISPWSISGRVLHRHDGVEGVGQRALGVGASCRFQEPRSSGPASALEVRAVVPWARESVRSPRWSCRWPKRRRWQAQWTLWSPPPRSAYLMKGLR